MLHHPQYLEKCEVSRDWQTCLNPELFPVFGCELIANGLAAGVAPNNSVVKWFSLNVPTYHSLSLISDSHSKHIRFLEVRTRQPCLLHCSLNALPDVGNNFKRVVLEPPLLRRYLLVLEEVLGNEVPSGGVDATLCGGG